MKGIASFVFRRTRQKLGPEIAHITVAQHLRGTWRVNGSSSSNPAYVAYTVSVSPTRAGNVFRGGEWRSMYVRAAA
ncbi:MULTISPECIES: hypothetical protein [Brucella]|uniref:Uncharacterized protein n=1 Tax=Brucella lupini TaxID=255457 RepID=A0A256GXB5_9HYPH|nr:MULTISPECIES: hypothetical protein [Brucella]OWJ69947.1 hypothetical protein CDV50_14860 [Haematobacter massiliensis]QOD62550.1 hypothetical protein HGK82_06860 [Ochrobactrum sp. MT180101]HCH73257.1 hypothetical protein [Ochrobactrum sp.]KAB2700641.1 hypothetical protein F9L03_24540 [Brucella lupini]OYR31837.1 hypothetical protein CES86_0644 [Brucella lupini]